MHWYMDDIPMMGISGKTVSSLIWMTAIVSGRIHCSTLCLCLRGLLRNPSLTFRCSEKGNIHV